MKRGTEFPSGYLQSSQEGRFLKETVLWVDSQTHNALWQIGFRYIQSIDSPSLSLGSWVTHTNYRWSLSRFNFHHIFDYSVWGFV